MNNRAFYDRHIGPDHDDRQVMLDALAISTLDGLIDETVPQAIRLEGALDLPDGASEAQALAQLSTMLDKNILNKSFIGAGFHGTVTPPVIARNLFENPAWYTAYTPYQAEISQGRLELLFHFQTLVAELTGLPVASASLLDEATAFAEANACAVRFFRGARTRIHLLGDLHPHVLAVAKTRAETQDIDFVEGGEIDAKTAAIVVPWPDTYGVFRDFGEDIRAAKAAGALVIAVADPLALTLLEAPATWGADMVAGSMQRYGVPMGFGGPHAGYMAVSTALTRLIPGRIVGQSIDTKGRVGYRLALQTREQHIRRDKATSNICTAQALLANMAAAYAIWHATSSRNISISRWRMPDLTWRVPISSIVSVSKQKIRLPILLLPLMRKAICCGRLMKIGSVLILTSCQPAKMLPPWSPCLGLRLPRVFSMCLACQAKRVRPISSPSLFLTPSNQKRI